MTRTILRRLAGPGLIFTGAAIGTSHLVQSTRAGAMFGVALLGVMAGVAALVLNPWYETRQQTVAATALLAAAPAPRAPALHLAENTPAGGIGIFQNSDPENSNFPAHPAPARNPVAAAVPRHRPRPGIFTNSGQENPRFLPRFPRGKRRRHGQSSQYTPVRSVACVGASFHSPRILALATVGVASWKRYPFT